MNTKVTHPQLFLPIAQSTSPQPYEANVAGPQVLTTVSNSDKKTNLFIIYKLYAALKS